MAQYTAIIEYRLIPYIPYYITRYEKELSHNGDISDAINDLEYFNVELQKLYEAGELSSNELYDIMNNTNRIIKHITDGNDYEDRMVNIMGGKVLEAPYHKLYRFQSEAIAYNLFKNGDSYNMVRNSISQDMISDERLEELMKHALANEDYEPICLD